MKFTNWRQCVPVLLRTTGNQDFDEISEQPTETAKYFKLEVFRTVLNTNNDAFRRP